MKDFYGDEGRWFIGTVIDATPPYGLEGRVRVRIHGVHNPSTREIAQRDLPWAQVLIPSTEGSVSGLGSSPAIKSGALVFGMFMDGKDSQIPIVVGSLPRIEYPTAIQKSLEFDTVIERLTPQEEFYNQSIASINVDTQGVEDFSVQRVGLRTQSARRATAIKFFLSLGYTMKQSCSIVAGLKFRSRFFTAITNPEDNSLGLAGWKGKRQLDLKNFNNEWQRYSVQLSFVAYELNTTQTKANQRILRVDSLDPQQDNCQTAVARYYLGLRDQRDVQVVINEGNNLYNEYIG